MDVEDLTKKFVGHLVNGEKFCTACENLEQNVKCDHCREKLKSHANSIYFYEQIGKNAPSFIEEPDLYLPKEIPFVDFLLVIGIHQDLLIGLPEYLKKKKINAVIIPIENPQWVPPGLQTQVLEQFEKNDIQAAFPKPFCSLSKIENEYNQVGFHLTKNHDLIDKFIDYFQIGEPIVSFLLNKDNKSIQDTCVLQSAPCGSTYYVVQQLKAKELENGGLSLDEKVSKAHHAYPCNASMLQDPILKDSILHVGGYLIRNAIRKELNLDIHESKKLNYIIK